MRQKKDDDFKNTNQFQKDKKKQYNKKKEDKLTVLDLILTTSLN
jgi:hypothetical protein